MIRRLKEKNWFQFSDQINNWKDLLDQYMINYACIYIDR